MSKSIKSFYAGACQSRVGIWKDHSGKSVKNGEESQVGFKDAGCSLQYQTQMSAVETERKGQSGEIFRRSNGQDPVTVHGG